MLYTENTKRAMKLCFEAHKEQVDKSGMLYVFHPFHLAEQMPDEEAISLMTHDKSVPYMEYVQQIKKNKIAATVKRADLMHNSDLSRLDVVDEKALKRAEKYKQTIAILDAR